MADRRSGLPRPVPAVRTESQPHAGGMLRGDVLVAGRAHAEKIVLTQPLSFWGGYDAAAGLIIDRTHPLAGASLAGKIMVMAHAKGSSSSSSVLAEAIRNGTGPLGIVLRERDLIIAIGALVAFELYRVEVPVVCVDARSFAHLVASTGPLRIEADAATGRAAIYVDAG